MGLAVSARCCLDPPASLLRLSLASALGWRPTENQQHGDDPYNAPLSSVWLPHRYLPVRRNVIRKHRDTKAQRPLCFLTRATLWTSDAARSEYINMQSHLKEPGLCRSVFPERPRSIVKRGINSLNQKSIFESNSKLWRRRGASSH